MTFDPTAFGRLVDLIKKLAVVHGKVTLSSGIEADYYVDLRRATLHHEAAPLIGQVMLDLLDLNSIDDFEAVGGLTMGADPVATAILHQAAARGRKIDAFVVRKAAKAHGMAVHSGDGRNFRVEQRAGDALDAAAVIGAGRIGLIEHPDALALLHRFEIAPGAEGLAIAGQDDAADALVVVERLQRGANVLAIFVRADRVHRLRLVHPEDRDAIAAFDIKKCAHVICPSVYGNVIAKCGHDAKLHCS